MKNHWHGIPLLLAALALTSAPGAHAGGGLVERPQNFDGSSNDITNPFWPLVPGSRLVYI